MWGPLEHLRAISAFTVFFGSASPVTFSSPQDLEKMLAGMKFGIYEVIIAKTETFFETNKSLTTKILSK